MIEVGKRWGPFEVLSLLGRGGNCTVYKVKKAGEDQVLALKVLQDSSNSLRFRREFRSMARLDHPNIARVYEYGTMDGTVYFTMEFIRGGDLKHKFKSIMAKRGDNGARMPQSQDDFRELGLLFKRICQPLKYIHIRKIIHRDLKPANIMLTETGDIKLMDFGLIKTLDLIQETLTQTGTFVGTVNYMSPEQGLCRPLDPRSDLYSLGVMMYEAFTGRLPFYAETIMEMFMKHIRDLPSPPNYYNPHIPPGYAQLIMRLLEKQPSDRPGSAEEVETYLDQCLEEKTIQIQDQDVVTIEAVDVLDDITVVSRPGLFAAGIVGRDEELQRISGLLDKISSSSQSLVFITGETGSGKTQFLNEIAVQARMKGCSVLRGACHEIERLPLSAVLRHLEMLAERLKQRPEKELKQILGNKGPILATVCPRFGEIDFVKSQPVPQPLEDLQEKLRVFDAIKTVFISMSMNHPLVLLIDNLHWADDLSYEFIHYFIRNINSESGSYKPPLMVIATYKTEDVAEGFNAFISTVKQSRDPVEIPLEPFDIHKTKRLISAFLGVRDPEETLLNLIYRESNGNPFFIEEILKNLIDQKILIQRRQKWFFDIERLKDTTPVGSDLSLTADLTLIPKKVQEVLSQRINELHRDLRDLLSRAAVIGSLFHFDILSAITNMDEDIILDLLDEALVDKILVEIPESGGQEFRFRNRMIRNILYCMIHGRKRIRLHLKIAEAVEAVFGTDSPEKWDILAYHYDKGKAPIKAIRYYLNAAEKGLQTHAIQTAREYSERVLELLSNLETDVEKYLDEWTRALRIHGRSAGILGDLKCAAEDFDKLIKIGRKYHDNTMESIGYYYLGGLKMDCGELDDALDMYEKSLSLIPDTPEQAYSRLLRENSIAQALMRKGQYKQALEIYLNLERKMKAIQHEEGLSLVQVNMGMLYYYMGRYDQAFNRIMANVERFRELDYQFNLARALNNLSIIYSTKGDITTALKYAQESLEISRHIDDLSSIAAISGNIALLYLDQGQYMKAAENCRESIQLSRRLDLKTDLAAGLINLSIILRIQGNIAESMQLIRESLEITRETGERWLTAHALLGYSECLAASEAYEEAFESFEKTLSVAEAIGLKTIIFQSRAYLLWLDESFIKTKKTGFDEDSILSNAQKLGDSECLMQIRYLFADMNFRKGRYDRARILAAPGLKTARQVNNAWFQWLFLVCIGKCLKSEEKSVTALKCFRKALRIVVAIEQNVEAEFRKHFICQNIVQSAFSIAKETALALDRKDLARHWMRRISGCRD